MPASKVISDGGSEAIEAQGFNTRQSLALIDPSNQSFGVQWTWSRHLASPQIHANNTIMLVVCFCAWQAAHCKLSSLQKSVFKHFSTVTH